MNFGRKRKWLNNTSRRRGRLGVHLDVWERNLIHKVEPFPKSVNLGNNFAYPSWEELIENIWKGYSLNGNWTFWANQSDFSLPASNSSRLPIVVRGNMRFASPPPGQPQCAPRNEFSAALFSSFNAKMSSSCDKTTAIEASTLVSLAPACHFFFVFFYCGF